MDCVPARRFEPAMEGGEMGPFERAKAWVRRLFCLKNRQDDIDKAQAVGSLSLSLSLSLSRARVSIHIHKPNNQLAATGDGQRFRRAAFFFSNHKHTHHHVRTRRLYDSIVCFKRRLSGSNVGLHV